jgi:hypothetical protein
MTRTLSSSAKKGRSMSRAQGYPPPPPLSPPPHFSPSRPPSRSQHLPLPSLHFSSRARRHWVDIVMCIVCPALLFVALQLSGAAARAAAAHVSAL